MSCRPQNAVELSCLQMSNETWQHLGRHCFDSVQNSKTRFKNCQFNGSSSAFFDCIKVRVTQFKTLRSVTKKREQRVSTVLEERHKLDSIFREAKGATTAALVCEQEGHPLVGQIQTRKPLAQFAFRHDVASPVIFGQVN